MEMSSFLRLIHEWNTISTRYKLRGIYSVIETRKVGKVYPAKQCV